MWPMTKPTRITPVTAITAFFPIEVLQRVITALAFFVGGHTFPEHAGVRRDPCRSTLTAQAGGGRSGGAAQQVERREPLDWHGCPPLSRLPPASLEVPALPAL